MLNELEVHDLGIIDSIRLEFSPGFTVLTGETGAGKSLLVQSLQLLGGGRADAEQVRSGCGRLLVEGCFASPGGAVAGGILAELGVPAGSELVIRREVTSAGRSRAWINDVPVTVGTLQRIAPFILAVHGQHEQRGLSDPSTHLALVDAAGGLGEVVGRVAEAFDAWQEARSALARQRAALAGRRNRLDVIAFEIREIEEVAPREGEDVELREERTWLRHAERIAELIGTARAALGGDGGSVALARAARALRELAELGLQVGDAAQGLEQAQWLAEEAEREVARLFDRTPADSARLEAVESRLASLERLTRKYGGTITTVLEHLAELRAEELHLASVEEDVSRLEAEEARCLQSYLSLAGELTRLRRGAAERLCRRVVEVLKRLAMPHVALRLQLGLRQSAQGPATVDGVRVEPARSGIDEGEILISTNPGEEMRPLARVASGGELSRVHLAIRTVLRELNQDRQNLTLLFDEVDAGIGGRVADELGRLLAELGDRDQVLVVTHLPQVASRASTHLAVQKVAAGGRSVTRVEALEGDSRVEEVVRMLGGTATTPAARQHARQLLRRR